MSSSQIEDTSHRKGGGGGTFLVPMNGGIWTMCVSLEGKIPALHKCVYLKKNTFFKQLVCFTDDFVFRGRGVDIVQGWFPLAAGMHKLFSKQ